MKFSRFLLVAGLLTGLSFPVAQANATVVGPTDYTGNFIDMTPTPLSVGQYGTITGSGSFGNVVMSLITGSLPSNSMASFTYEFSGLMTSSYLTSTSGYSFMDGMTPNFGYTTAADTSVAPGSFSYSISYVGATPSATALAVSSAQIDTLQKATLVIKNLSGGALTFANTFIGTLLGSTNFTVAYNISAVPVPAALPLFGLGLSALGAMRLRARRKNAALAA